MSIYINQEMAPEWAEDSLPSARAEPVIGTTDFTAKSDAKITADLAKERAARAASRLTGKQRFLALCKTLGLYPSTFKNNECKDK